MTAKRPISGDQSSNKRQRGNESEGLQDHSPQVVVNNAERDCWEITLHYWDMNGYEAFGGIEFSLLLKETGLCWSDDFALSMSKLAACVVFRNNVAFFHLCLKFVNAMRYKTTLPDIRGPCVSTNMQALRLLRDEIYVHHLNGFSSGNTKTIIQQAIQNHTIMFPYKHAAIFKDKYFELITRDSESQRLPEGRVSVDQEDLNNLTKVVNAYTLDAGFETIDSSWKTHGHTEISDENFILMKLAELRRLKFIPQLNSLPNQISSMRQNAMTTYKDSESSTTNQGLSVYQESTKLQDIECTTAAIIPDHESYAKDVDPKEMESLNPANLRSVKNTERKVGEEVPNQALNEAENLESSHMFTITDSPDISDKSNTDTEDEAENLEPRHILMTGSRGVSEVSDIDADLLIYGLSDEIEEPGSEYNDLFTREASYQSEELELSHFVQFRLVENSGKVIDETNISSVESFEQLIGWIRPFLSLNVVFKLWVKQSSNGKPSIVESDGDWAIAKEQFHEEHDDKLVTTIFVTEYENAEQSASAHTSIPETFWDVDFFTSHRDDGEEDEGSEWGT